MPSKPPRATAPPHSRGAADPAAPASKLPFAREEIVSATDDRSDTPIRPGRSTTPSQRLAKLPFARQEIVGAVDERSHEPMPAPPAPVFSAPPPPVFSALHAPSLSAPRAHAFSAPPAPVFSAPPAPAFSAPPAPPAPPSAAPTGPAAIAASGPHPLPRATTELTGPPAHLPIPDPARTESAQLPEVDLDLAPSRLRARGTPVRSVAPLEQIRTLVFAPEPDRAAWIERELSHPPITIQVGRRVRTVVAALLRDPPPRPDVLVIDFDALMPADLLELQSLRREGWFGRLIALGDVPPELRAALRIDHVLAEPLVRDSLLDCVAGTRHAVTTIACPVIPDWDDRS